MSNGELGPRFSDTVERPQSPQEQLECFLDLYKKIQKLAYELIETGPNLDLGVKAMKRALLADYFKRLGFDYTDPDAWNLLEECYQDTMARTRNPQPVIDIPDIVYFQERIEYAKHARVYPVSGKPAIHTPTLSEVAEYGHTSWGNVHSRNPSRVTTPQYIKDVATLIADPVAYTLTFHSDDAMEVSSGWAIENGRHRSLAAVCLGQAVIAESGIDEWVRVNVA